MILFLLGAFGLALMAFGGLQWAQGVATPEVGVPAGFPAIAQAGFGMLETTAGALILAVCIGLSTLIKLVREAMRQHPGAVPPMTMRQRLLGF